jgi:pimeloyl-ACP methyl ester carboxylesterase
LTDELRPTGVGLDLEVIDKGVCTEAHPTPLLFVHGAWHAAWCWSNFLDFFADKGYRCLALSLRGHGRSRSSTPLRTSTLADYVADVESVAASLPSRPVVIGHSLGGGIVQKYLESSDAPAGVLMASMPPRGSGGFTLRLTARHPWLMTRSLVTGNALHGFNTPAVARGLFFSSRTPESDVLRCASQLGNVSQRVGLDTLLLNRPKPDRVTTRLLVLGAEQDACITRAEVDATARADGTDAEFFDVGHDMMLEPGWAAVAERICAWLGERGL